MDDFEKYWLENVEQYRATARKAFDRKTSGPWCADITIDEDDDFQLDVGSSFTVFGQTKKALVNAVIVKLQEAKFTYVKSWKMTNGDQVTEGTTSSSWFSLRDEAIRRLKAKNTMLSFGGNQTIDIHIYENT
jgi:hypothetical protein